jgi:hypothetical protein
MSFLEHMEMWSYIVTIFGFPMAILVYVKEKSKERENEEEEIYQQLSDEYAEFLKLVIKNSDLQLRSGIQIEVTNDQLERKLLIFDILISLFERAYLLAYEDEMDNKKKRRWQSWEDYMIEWCRRDDFRKLLPTLLEGEDEAFSTYIQSIANSCALK